MAKVFGKLEMSARNTLLQFSTPTSTPAPTPTPFRNLEALLIYYIWLSWSRDHFVYLATNMGQHCNDCVHVTAC